MKPFDIYLAQFTWRGCPDARPWLLIRRDGAAWKCFPITGQDYDADGFELRDDDPDFPATGLRETSYVIDYQMELVPEGRLLSRWGELSGDLLARFRSSAGI